TKDPHSVQQILGSFGIPHAHCLPFQKNTAYILILGTVFLISHLIDKGFIYIFNLIISITLRSRCDLLICLCLYLLPQPASLLAVHLVFRLYLHVLNTPSGKFLVSIAAGAVSP